MPYRKPLALTIYEGMDGGVQPGDYVTWQNRDGSPDVGRVVLIRENELGQYLREELGIPIRSASFLLVDTGEGLRVVVDLVRGLQRVWIQ